MASWCISTIYDQNSLDISPRSSRGLISREFWSYIVDIHQEAMVYIYLYHDAATLQRQKLGYKTDILPRVVYNPLMFDILPACG